METPSFLVCRCLPGLGGRKANPRDSVGERLVHSRLTPPRALTAVIPWKGEGVRHLVDEEPELYNN